MRHRRFRLIALVLSLSSSCALAAQAPLIERALQCKLADKDLAPMMRNLAAANPGMKKPTLQNGAPTFDLYQLSAPVEAFGYKSTTIVVMPGKIMLAVSGATFSQASASLKLEASSDSPASRVVRPTVSVVAFQLSARPVDGKLLVGCEYANPDAAAWVAPDGF